MTQISYRILLLVSIFGALGVGLRFFLTPIFVKQFLNFPLGTLVINSFGSLAMGICYVLFAEKGVLTENQKLYLMTGLLGGFTTFSSYSIEMILLFQARAWGFFTLYALGSPILGFGFAYCGLLLARAIF